MTAPAVIEAHDLSLTFQTSDGPVYALSHVDLSIREPRRISNGMAS